MKLKELKELLKIQGKEFAEIEAYTYYTYINERNKSLHTDCIELTDVSDNTDVKNYVLMGEEEYNQTILANQGYSVDYEDIYGDKNAKLLIVIVDEINMEEKRIRVVGWQDQYQNYENYERGEYMPCNPDYDKTFDNLEEAMEFYDKIILEDIKVEWKNRSFYVENKSIFYCDEDGNETEEIENAQSKVTSIWED